jgi:ankyrin repeat protein
VLHFAALNSNDDMVNLLIEAEAKVDAYDQHGMTPLHGSALASSDSGVLPIRTLIEAGAEVDQTDMFGRTALHFAAGMDHEAVLACLIAYGANVNTTDDINGWTALHWAADKGYEGIARCLLKCGSSLELQDKFGKTAAAYAEDGGHKFLAVELRGSGGGSPHREKVVSSGFSTDSSLTGIEEDSDRDILPDGLHALARDRSTSRN